MLFTLTDVILIVIVLAFVMLGFFMGLISAIGALVGVVAGAWISSIYFLDLANWLSPYLLGMDGTAKVVAFILIFTLVNRVVALLFWIIGKVFKLISIIPFLKSIDRLGGAILGFVEGSLVVGTVVFVISKFSPNIPWLLDNLNSSRIAHILVWVTQFLSNFIP
jgi:membrane protein required for colicin V production